MCREQENAIRFKCILRAQGPRRLFKPPDGWRRAETLVKHARVSGVLEGAYFKAVPLEKKNEGARLDRSETGDVDSWEE